MGRRSWLTCAGLPAGLGRCKRCPTELRGFHGAGTGTAICSDAPRSPSPLHIRDISFFSFLCLSVCLSFFSLSQSLSLYLSLYLSHTRTHTLIIHFNSACVGLQLHFSVQTQHHNHVHLIACVIVHKRLNMCVFVAN